MSKICSKESPLIGITVPLSFQLSLAHYLRFNFRKDRQLSLHKLYLSGFDIPLYIGVLSPPNDLIPFRCHGEGDWKLCINNNLVDFSPQVAAGSWSETSLRLDDIPSLRQYAKDVAPYWSLAVVAYGDGDISSIGIYRVQVIDGGRATVNVLPGSALSDRLKKQKILPVTIMLGCDYATLLAAATLLGQDVDKYAFAGYVQQAPLTLSYSPINRLLIPSQVPIVVEGFIDGGDTGWHGPFGNHTGGYVAKSLQPVFNLKGIYTSQAPFVSNTLVGKPLTENSLMAVAWESLFSRLFMQTIPGFKQWRFVREALFCYPVIIQVDEDAWLSREQFLNGIKGIPWFFRSRLIVLVNHNVPISNNAYIAKLLLRNINWGDSLIKLEHGWLVDLTSMKAVIRGKCSIFVNWGKHKPKCGFSLKVWRIINHGLGHDKVKVIAGVLHIDASLPENWVELDN